MRVLLAEDDDILADALVSQLSQVGFDVRVAHDGRQALGVLNERTVDLAVLDIGLPIMDGLSVLREVRVTQPELPILILTAMDGLEHRVSGLNAGADDYLTKPFDFPELEARVRALLRRLRPAQPATGAQTWGGLVFDRSAHKALVNDEVIELSPREWELLDLLLAQRDKVVTKDDIAKAWTLDRQQSGPSSIEVYIHRLRRKLEPSGLSIRTVRGLGYLLEAAK
jgi:two-component system OmpR family response regulator